MSGTDLTGWRRLWGLSKRCGLPFLLLALSLACPAAYGAGSPIPALIVRVEGEGLAKLRKKSGVESVAGVSGQMFTGDRIMSDAKSLVHLLLSDGTVLKIGPASELKFDSVQINKNKLSWSFSLTQGALLGRLEKAADATGAEIRIGTPSAMALIKGAAFLLAYEKKSNVSKIFTIEDELGFGEPACESKNGCINVVAGNGASLGNASTSTVKAQPFSLRDLFALSANISPSADANSAVPPIASNANAAFPEEANARLALFRGLRAASGSKLENTNDEALGKILGTATEELASAQDRAIGRSRAQREEMAAAIKKGSFGRSMAAGQEYAMRKDLSLSGKYGGAEAFLGTVSAATFRLGKAVLMATTAGAVVGESFSEASFELKKTEGYSSSDSSQHWRNILSAAEKDYSQKLELVGSHKHKLGSNSTEQDLASAISAISDFWVASYSGKQSGSGDPKGTENIPIPSGNAKLRKSSK